MMVRYTYTRFSYALLLTVSTGYGRTLYRELIGKTRFGPRTAREVCPLWSVPARPDPAPARAPRPAEGHARRFCRFCPVSGLDFERESSPV